MASGDFCVDEDALLAAHRARLLAMPAAAFRVRVEVAQPAGGLAPPGESFADQTVRASIVDRLLSRECVAEQHNLGLVMQYAHTPYLDAKRAAHEVDSIFLAAMPPRAALGNVRGAPEEALCWFLAAARHGDVVAMAHVAQYLQAQRTPDSLDLERLTPWTHDAAFYLWKAMQHGAPVDAAATLDCYLYELQDVLVPLALKDAQGAVDADTVKRLVRLLHTGPRLAEAAAPPYLDAAAQFLLATQLLGTPAPRVRLSYDVTADTNYVSSSPLAKYTTTELHNTMCVSSKRAKAEAKANARVLLQASAAAGFEPAVSFLAAAGADLRAALGPQPEALQLWYDRFNGDGVASLTRLVFIQSARATRAERQLLAKAAAAASVNSVVADPGNIRAPGERCERCGRTDVKMKLCGKCRAARYCSEACQRAAWKLHKKTCVPVEAP